MDAPTLHYDLIMDRADHYRTLQAGVDLGHGVSVTAAYRWMDNPYPGASEIGTYRGEDVGQDAYVVWSRWRARNIVAPRQ